MDRYRVIDEKEIINFVKKNMDAPVRKTLGLKIPIIGSNRGKLLVPESVYSYLIFLYLDLKPLIVENMEFKVKNLER
jgi:hypothetical protein